MVDTCEAPNYGSTRIFWGGAKADYFLNGNFYSGSNSNTFEIELYTGIDWFDEIEGKISKFKLLEKDWDSYEGLQIDEVLISAAIQILSEIKSLGRKIPKPFVGPVGNGGIDIQWDCGESFFSIKLRKGGSSRYFHFDRKSNLDKNGSIQISKAGKVDGSEISNIIDCFF